MRFSFYQTIAGVKKKISKVLLSRHCQSDLKCGDLPSCQGHVLNSVEVGKSVV